MGANSPAVQLGSTRRESALPPDAPLYKRLWRGWQRVARAIGNLFSRIVTTLAYVVVLPIFALGIKLFADPLGLKPGPARWTPLPPVPSDLEEARRGL
jgi:hypothetical protein